MTGFVYAIAAENGLIKIGFSTNPYLRLTKINSDTSSPCRLVSYIAATKTQEGELHGLLWDASENGEWYRPSKAVMAFVGMLPTLPVRQTKRRHGIDVARHPLTAYRARNSISLQDLAVKLGVRRTTVCRWERRQMRVSTDIVFDVERLTGIPKEELRPDLFHRSAAE